MDEELVENLAREIYNVRSQSPREMDDERWERVKARFPGSVRICRQAAVEMIESGEFYGDD